MQAARNHAAAAPPPFCEAEVTAAGLGATSLQQVFTPVAAAEALRALGRAEMTACALRPRAYRQQVPFPLNGGRIVSTLAALREIPEGQPRRPRPLPAAPPPVLPRPVPRRRPVHNAGQ